MPETAVVACCPFWWMPLLMFGVMALACLLLMWKGGMCGMGKKKEE